MTRAEVWAALFLSACLAFASLGAVEWMSRESAKLNAAAYEQGNQDARILGRLKPSVVVRPLVVTLTVRVRHLRTWRSYTVHAETAASWGELRGEVLDALVAEIKRAPSTLEQCEIEMGEEERHGNRHAKRRKGN